MTNTDAFRFSVGDDPDYDDLTVEIYYKETFVAMITQDQGFEDLKLNIFSNPSGEVWNFKLDEFLSTIKCAKQKLWDLRRLD